MTFVDFIGRIENTPLSPRQGLMPLLEAIFNSIQAIQEANNKDGEIKVVIRRSIDGLLITDDEQIRTAPISGVDIYDNGVGFNKQNYESFCLCDSRKKREIGGKGVGRFLWLKAFEKIEVVSVFFENDRKFSRSFGYILSNDPIIDESLKPAEENSEVLTKVSLQNIKPEFLEHLPRSLEVLAYRIIEHCLEYFVLGTMPKIYLSDEKDTILLSEKYSEMVAGDTKSEFNVGESNFTIIHFILRAIPNVSHKLNFCANHRVAQTKKLDSRIINNLPARIPANDDSKELFYLGYVSSPFLDSHVNQQRTGFDTVSEGQMRFVGQLSWDEIEEKAIHSVKDYLEPITEPIGEAKVIQIQDYINKEAPEFRGLLRHRHDAINEISPDIQPEKLEIELYKKQKEWEVSLKEQAKEIITNPTDNLSTDGEAEKEKYLHFLEEWNESGKATLAKYVIHRKTTLTLLEKYMQSDEDGGFARERTIHQLIFPLKRTSDDIDYGQQNLWVIDEKLAFHSYLSSDLELRQVEPLESKDLDRPDLLIFDNPIAVVDGEPINGITIFEFKRPMRGNSNPVSQMYNYVRKIRLGKASTNHQRPIVVREETPFYCYAVCDLPNSLRTEIENMGMQKTPDNEGYFVYNTNLRTYVEVISYNKLLRDAQLRNRVLFEKLNITK